MRCTVPGVNQAMSAVLQDRLTFDAGDDAMLDLIMAQLRDLVVKGRASVPIGLQEPRDHLVLVRTQSDGLGFPVDELRSPDRVLVHLGHVRHGDREGALGIQQVVELCREIGLEGAAALFDGGDRVVLGADPLRQGFLRVARRPADWASRAQTTFIADAFFLRFFPGCMQTFLPRRPSA
jgi:hypothetical protein